MAFSSLRWEWVFLFLGKEESLLGEGKTRGRDKRSKEEEAKRGERFRTEGDDDFIPKKTTVF